MIAWIIVSILFLLMLILGYFGMEQAIRIDARRRKVGDETVKRLSTTTLLTQLARFNNLHLIQLDIANRKSAFIDLINIHQNAIDLNVASDELLPSETGLLRDVIPTPDTIYLGGTTQIKLSDWMLNHDIYTQQEVFDMYRNILKSNLTKVYDQSTINLIKIKNDRL